MNDLLKAALPATIALLGTVLTLSVAYGQWKRNRHDAAGLPLLEKKRAAYQALWENLEDAHVKLRTSIDVTKEEEFHTLLREINSFLIRNALFIEQDDCRVAQEYVAALGTVASIVKTCGNKEAEVAWQITAEIPDDVAGQVEALREATDQVARIREQLRVRCRAVLTNGKL